MSLHQTEEWREIADFPGYFVSDQGRVMSTRRGNPHVLRPSVQKWGHRTVSLSRDARAYPRKVHRLVLEAFVGPCPDGMEACHRNDVAGDNRLSNLYWGSHSENMRDRINNGNNPFLNLTHCKRGHEFVPENTWINVRGHRVCKSCVRLHRKAVA